MHSKQKSSGFAGDVAMQSHIIQKAGCDTTRKPIRNPCVLTTFLRLSNPRMKSARKLCRS